MILQQLCNDADRLVEGMPPSMYDVRPVRWVVHLDNDGGCHWPPERLSGGGQKDSGKMLLVPNRKRTGTKAPPLLLADKRSFTWGLPGEKSKAKDEAKADVKAKQEHQSYLELLDRCAQETGEADVAVVARFLRSWDPALKPLPSDLEEADLTTFTVEGRYPIHSRAVQQFWAREAAGTDEDGDQGQCLVCSARTRIVRRLPASIKGLPASPGGAELISGNLAPAESYGLKEALTSPVCQECGERFGKAANALIKNPKTHLDVGPVTYLFWAPESEFDPCGFLSEPNPEEVRQLLDSARKGRPPAPGDDSPFYATSLSVYVNRVVVRGWIDTTVGQARRNLERWFRLQRLVDGWGDDGKPLSVFRLAVGLYRKAKDVPARVPDLLLRTALHGESLPEWLLQQAVLRNQAERDLTYPRAALVKLVLCSQGKEDPVLMSALKPDHPSPAYHCGRLLAELEAIQQSAVPGINATLVDRFYTGASTAPGRVFGRLLSGVQAHLGKLRKENSGAYHRHSRVLEEIMGSLQEFPQTLVVQDQALFSLGYYHQRAENRKARRQAAEARRTMERTEPQGTTYSDAEATTSSAEDGWYPASLPTTPEHR